IFTVTLTPCPTASYIAVWLFGGGPGLNFDFARLSFHVPMMASVCAMQDSEDVMNIHTARKATTRLTPIKVLRILIVSPCKMLSSDNRTPPPSLSRCLMLHISRRAHHSASAVDCLRH